MSNNIKLKVKLNPVTHSVRASQAVLQYGVGAMVDFPNQTLVTAAPEYWNEKSIIHDDRLAKSLNVDYFALPTTISYVRFPEWYFCPKCRTFQPLNKWVADYRKKAQKKTLESDEHMVSHMKCPTCKQDLVVARIVTICENGHLNDFPWVKWVHARSKKQICSNPSLKFKTSASGTEGLDGIYIECTCGAGATLKDAFDKKIFEKMDKDPNSPGFRCEGCHPFKHTKETCEQYPRTVQRGASSIYFPVTHSSIVIPPYADKLNSKIEQTKTYELCKEMIAEEDTEEDVRILIEKKLNKWSEKIAMEIGANPSDIERILTRKWLDEPINVPNATSIEYRFDEYMALTGEISTPNEATGDFSREAMPIEEYNIPHVKSVALIDKVRVVNAFTGFSRINTVFDENSHGFVSAKSPKTRWYPAYEVRGEGIFIEFDQNDIDNWIKNNPKVSSRAQVINENYRNSFIGQNNPRNISPKFILLHTISHLLITQLSFECGYSVASLCERLYCAEASDGKEMAGIFIYTACGDSEGTLGGLVRQGRSDALPRIFMKAVNSAKTCSNDPVCIMYHGQGLDSLNLAACHACALLPETCCEEKNVLLDRALIIGTPENKKIGFWSQY